MKIAFVAASAFVSATAFADGIPVPMEQQTKYNWNCDKNGNEAVSLHLLITTDRTGVLFVSYGGGVVGAKLSNEASNALVKKDFAQLNGKAVVDKNLGRTFSFEFKEKRLNVSLRGKGFAQQALNCQATF